MTDTARTTALVLARGLAASGVGHLICDPVRAGSVPVRCVRSIVRRAALRPLARRLMASSLSERREIAALLSAALDAGHYSAALALVSTAGRRPDLYAEKILSQRYRFLWLGVPKAASRSVIAALRAADPKALLVHKLSLDELLAAYPEARDYFRFAFLRHPYARLLSFYADKHVRGRHDRAAYRWFIEPWRGLRPGMGFDELCRWLCTPCGSDAFADRHWLSQSRQVIAADGRLPDYLGRCETLDAGWRTVCERLELPGAPLPRLNAGGYDAMPGGRIDIDAGLCGLLRRRYAEDYRLGDYGEAPPGWPQ